MQKKRKNIKVPASMCVQDLTRGQKTAMCSLGGNTSLSVQAENVDPLGTAHTSSTRSP